MPKSLLSFRVQKHSVHRQGASFLGSDDRLIRHYLQILYVLVFAPSTFEKYHNLVGSLRVTKPNRVEVMPMLPLKKSNHGSFSLLYGDREINENKPSDPRAVRRWFSHPIFPMKAKSLPTSGKMCTICVPSHNGKKVTLARHASSPASNTRYLMSTSTFFSRSQLSHSLCRSAPQK